MIKDPTLEAQSKGKKEKKKKEPFPKTSLASRTATRYCSEMQMTDQQDEMDFVPGFTVPLQEF